MSTAKHTPGPWVVQRTRDVGPSDGVVCSVWSAIGTDSNDALRQADANCHLIAAAPELLEVLQQILADRMHCDVVPHLHYKALAVIGKALGDAA